MPSKTISFKQTGTYIKESWNKTCEPFQPPYEFLYRPKKPKVGQRVEVQYNGLDGKWCHLTGVVTDVGPWFIKEELFDGAGEGLSEDFLANNGITRENFDETKVMTLIKPLFESAGTMNGQEVVVYAFLNNDFYFDDDGSKRVLPFKMARIYKVRFKGNPSLVNRFVAQEIIDVTDEPPDTIPEAFRKWALKSPYTSCECCHGELIKKLS